MTLMLILKYIMLAMSLSNQLFRNMYNLTIMTIMYSILTFHLDGLKIESKKYELVCYLGQMELLLKNIMLYVYKENESVVVDIVIPKKKVKSLLTLSLP